MDYSKLLNKEQYEAVQCTEGAVLVSAGAGSGKTRLLTHRIGYLITENNVLPENILAITFTNKAANEMKERLIKFIPVCDKVTACTFHSFCARLLRKYIEFMPKYTSNFTIYSDPDRNKILKIVFDELKIEDNDTKDKLDYHFSNCKNSNMNIDEYVQIYAYLPIAKYILDGYKIYQRELIKNNAMDFDDLLINAYALLNENPSVLERVQDHYKYISVDEFQDTNKAQYDLVRLIASKYNNILVVGDEDQSIYGWRGANVQNLFNFKKDFPGCKIFKLEENYRSTKAILDKANILIKNNSQRMDKTLYTKNEQGAEVEFLPCYDEQAEADLVIRNIMNLKNQGVDYDNIAILMRLNALSRPFEEKLLMYNIPHKVYGGFKFYERAEIKNVLAYFIAIINSRDSQNILRIINFPKRGIGMASIEKLQEIANTNEISLSEVILKIEDYDLPSSLVNKILPLKVLLEDFNNKVQELSLSEFAEYVVGETGIKSFYNTQDEQDIERSMNISSLIQSIKEFDSANSFATLGEYLESVTLMTDMDTDAGNNSVTIATVHSAKGLEFDAVFVVGLEDGCFPLSRRGFVEDLEEERRLMYVAITRARKVLKLTNSKNRFLYGHREFTVSSRFLKEMDMIKISMPKTGFNSEQFSSRPSQNVTNNDNSPRLSKDQAKLGMKVYHPHFGKGEIVDINSVLVNGAISIKFENFGVKVLSLDYAPITVV